MKMRCLAFAALAAVILLGRGIQAEDEAQEKEFSCKCPVSGADAKEESYVEFKTKKVYFCCDNCPKKFKEDPSAFAAKAYHQLLVTEQMIQVACPFTGGPVNADTMTDIEGVEVGFCCEKCQAKAAKAEDKVALIFGDISKGYTLQTECPVSGEKIDIKQVVEHKEQKVYFCCDKCPAAFKADPDKYLAKLPQFAEEEKKAK